MEKNYRLGTLYKEMKHVRSELIDIAPIRESDWDEKADAVYKAAVASLATNSIVSSMGPYTFKAPVAKEMEGHAEPFFLVASGLILDRILRDYNAQQKSTA